jgi:hypothetical protein
MNHELLTRRLFLTLPVTLLAALNTASAADLRKKTLDAWQTYVQLTEERIAAELERGQGFLVRDFKAASEVEKIQATTASGKPYIARMQTRSQANTEIKVQDGIIHHRYGSVFIPGARMADVLNWVQNFDQYHDYFSEVEQSKLVSRNGDLFNIFLRLTRTKLGITVHYNTDYTFAFRRHDTARTSGRMISTRIAEIDDVGSRNEKERPPGQDSGYFWRSNFYWRYLEAKDGTSLECESVSLSREVPFGLGFVFRGFVESIAEETVENVLVSIRAGVMQQLAKRSAVLIQ